LERVPPGLKLRATLTDYNERVFCTQGGTYARAARWPITPASTRLVLFFYRSRFFLVLS
jgi:hypothetical protein